jgi:hypothetical protein
MQRILLIIHPLDNHENAKQSVEWSRCQNLNFQKIFTINSICPPQSHNYS